MRLIDADAAANKIMREAEIHADEIGDGTVAIMIVFARAMRDENNFPTIEAEPVRHGQWKWADGYVGTTAECSVCGLSPMGFYSLPMDQIGRLPEYKYCPRCGARMDGGAEDG